MVVVEAAFGRGSAAVEFAVCFPQLGLTHYAASVGGVQDFFSPSWGGRPQIWSLKGVDDALLHNQMLSLTQHQFYITLSTSATGSLQSMTDHSWYYLEGLLHGCNCVETKTAILSYNIRFSISSPHINLVFILCGQSNRYGSRFFALYGLTLSEMITASLQLHNAAQPLNPNVSIQCSMRLNIL